MRALVLALLMIASPVFAKDREVLTPAHAEIAPGGGVVIASAESLGDARRSDWAFRGEAPPAVHAIAPGLEVYELPPNDADTVALVEDTRTIVEVVRAHAARPMLGAPRIAAVRTRQLAGRTRRTYTSVAAQLLDAPPARAVALVAYRVQAGQREPLSWGAVDGDDDEVEIYLEAGPCRTEEPRLGDRIVFAWLDTSGRLSALSSELVVTR